MIIVPGRPGKDLCDAQLGVTRRDILRVGGSGLLGLGLGSMLELQAVSACAADASRGPGWGKAKSIIMVYLQGGPSHLDLWDPKDNVPDNVRSVFKPIATKVPGTFVTEVLPKLAQITDKFTFVRSMSYTPNGLFNHTAAIYQMMTGYTTDKVSPSGQLEPPSPKDFPNFGSQLIKLQPPTVPMLPFVMLPRPFRKAESSARVEQPASSVRRTIPTRFTPKATTWIWRRWTGSRSTICNSGPKSSPAAQAPRQASRSLERRHARNRQGRRRLQAHRILRPGAVPDRLRPRSRGLPDSGRTGPDPRPVRPKHIREKLPPGAPADQAGTKVVEVVWPKVANSENHSWDHHVDYHPHEIVPSRARPGALRPF